MPYIQRDARGRICGLYQAPQPQPDGFPLTEPDPLPDDHPEVVAFLEKMPKIPAQMLAMMTREELEKSTRQHAQLLQDHEALATAIRNFNGRFSELENAMSALLSVALKLQDSSAGLCIYFSPTSFDTRVRLVENVVMNFLDSEPGFDPIRPYWSKLSGKIDRLRELRNKVAHGSPITIQTRNGPTARLTSPAFDPMRFARPIAKQQLPGVDAGAVAAGVKAISKRVEEIDGLNRLIHDFHEGHPNFAARFRRLVKLSTVALP